MNKIKFRPFPQPTPQGFSARECVMCSGIGQRRRYTNLDIWEDCPHCNGYGETYQPAIIIGMES